jgi:aminoglycoside phosphotransferase (APT) family kinase protein
MNVVLDSILSAGVLPGSPRRAHVSPVKLDTTALPGGSLVMLLFVNDDPEPRYVLRMPRTPEQPERLIRNYESLEDMMRLDGVANTVPEPVYCGQLGGTTASVETCVPGLPLAVLMRAAREEGRNEHFARLFSLAADWIWELHAETAQTETHFGEQIEAEAQRVVRVLHPAGMLTDAQASSLLESARAAACCAHPIVRIHGDFNPNNTMLAEDGRLYVIDWEFSGPGWALYDVFTLARTSWFHPAANVPPDAVRAQALWDPRTSVGKAFARAISRYERRHQVARSEIRALFGIYVAGLVAEQVEPTPATTSTSMDAWQALLAAALTTE